MSRGQMLEIWMLVSLLHFLATFSVLSFGFDFVVRVYFGTSAVDRLVITVAEALVQPAAALIVFFGVQGDPVYFWLIFAFHSALWGAALVLAATVIHRRLSRKHAF